MTDLVLWLSELWLCLSDYVLQEYDRELGY